MASVEILAERFRSTRDDAEVLQFNLRNGRFVSLSRYDDDRGSSFVWPTPFRSRDFFDNATTTLGFDYESVRDNLRRDRLRQPIEIPKDELQAYERILEGARLSLPDDLGELGWAKSTFGHGHKIGIVVTDRLSEVPLEALLSTTGTHQVVANLGQIVTQTMAELS